MSQKKQALVGEKSQAVYSANWKLDAVLQRELQMLDTSEKRVTHRISLDQRVVNMRFQQKLHRSKIFHARMTGNKEMLRDLLKHDNYNFKLSRNDPETLPPAYLRNLQSRARSAPPTREKKSSPTRDERSRPKTSSKIKPKSAKIRTFGMTPAATSLVKGTENRTQVDTDNKSKDTLTTVKNDITQDMSTKKTQDASVKKRASEDQKTPPKDNDKVDQVTQEKTRSDEVVSKTDDDDIPRLTHVMRKATLSATVRSPIKPLTSHRSRPKTAVGTMPIIEATDGTDVTQEEHNKVHDVRNAAQDAVHGDSVESSVPQEGSSSADDKVTNASTKTEGDPQGSILGPVDVEKTPESAIENQDTVTDPSNPDGDKKPNVSFRPAVMAAVLGATIEQQFIKGRQEEAANNSKHSMPSIFGEEKKTTILDLNAERIKNADYPGRVKKFGEKMDSYKDPENVDYYALRLAEKVNLRTQRRRGNSFSKSEANLKAERDLAKRSIGDIKAKNMTFRSVTKPL